MQWGDELDAAQWAQRLANDPGFAEKIANDAKEAGLTKDMLARWAEWYQNNFNNWKGTANQPDPPPQFQFRSDGLQILQNRLPSISAPVPCPANPLCA
jgi:hypothetical protein